jgi:hypothetical protein
MTQIIHPDWYWRLAIIPSSKKPITEFILSRQRFKIDSTSDGSL